MKNKQTTCKSTSFHFSGQHFSSLLAALFLCASLSFASADAPSVQIEMSSSSVTLSWNDTGADSYNIYKNSELLTSTTDTTFTVSVNSGTNLFYVSSFTVGETPIVAAASYSYTTFEGNKNYGISSSELFTNAGTMSAIDSISGAGWTFVNDSLQAAEFYMGIGLDTLLFYSTGGDAQVVIDKNIENRYNVALHWMELDDSDILDVTSGFTVLRDTLGLEDTLFVNDIGITLFRAEHNGPYTAEMQFPVLAYTAFAIPEDSSRIQTFDVNFGIQDFPVPIPSFAYTGQTPLPSIFLDWVNETSADEVFRICSYKEGISQDSLSHYKIDGSRRRRTADYPHVRFGGEETGANLLFMQTTMTELANETPETEFFYSPNFPIQEPSVCAIDWTSGPLFQFFFEQGIVNYNIISLEPSQNQQVIKTEVMTGVGCVMGEWNGSSTPLIFADSSRTIIKPLFNEQTRMNQWLAPNSLPINDSRADNGYWTPHNTGSFFLTPDQVSALNEYDPSILEQADTLPSKQAIQFVASHVKRGSDFRNHVEANRANNPFVETVTKTVD